MKFPFQRIKINEFEDPYKEIWQEHWTLRVLKFVGTDCSAGINGHNSLVRNQFWANEDSLKRKIHALRMEQCFSTCSFLEIERKIREDETAIGQRGIEGGDDDAKQ